MVARAAKLHTALRYLYYMTLLACSFSCGISADKKEHCICILRQFQILASAFSDEFGLCMMDIDVFHIATVVQVCQVLKETNFHIACFNYCKRKNSIATTHSCSFGHTCCQLSSAQFMNGDISLVCG